MIRRWLSFLLMMLIPLSSLAAGLNQATPISYRRYDVEITVRPNGTFHVKEIQEIYFGDRFTQAYAQIPTNYTQKIENVTLSENDIPYLRDSAGPGTYTVADEGMINIVWEYTPTRAGDIRTFVLEYDVRGGLWVYPKEKIMEWRGVPADRSGIDVETSKITVILPETATESDIRAQAYGPKYIQNIRSNQVVFQATEAIPDGTHFQVQVGFTGDLVTAEIQPWQREEDLAQLQYNVESFESDLTLNLDGSLNVLESQRIAVLKGQLETGSRDLSMYLLDGIEIISLVEGGQDIKRSPGACDYCYTIYTDDPDPTWARYNVVRRKLEINPTLAGEINLDWTVPPLVTGESTSFILGYRALGALSVYSDHQELNWTAIYTDHDHAFNAATITLHLPSTIPADQIQITGGIAKRMDDGSYRLVSPGPIPAQEGWVIHVTLPANATPAKVPTWQTQLTTAIRNQQVQEVIAAQQRMAIIVLGIVCLLGGIVAVLLIWYLWGRDPAVQLPGEFLHTPPSNLPPGIVAYLLDEKPTVKGVLASVFHLATLGLLRIDLTDGLKIQRNSDQPLTKGTTVQLADGTTVPIPNHLIVLYEAISPAISTAYAIPFQSIGAQFYEILPEVYKEMGQETQLFFDELPERSQRLWSGIGIFITFGGLISCCLLGNIGTQIGPIFILPGLAMIVTGIALIIISTWMPRRTSKGAMEAARWRAFKRHLENLKKYNDLGNAQEILDRYFAYAVALDVDHVVLKQAEDLGALAPIWILPTTVTHQDNLWTLNRPTRSSHSESGTPLSVPEISTPTPSVPTPPQTPPLSSFQVPSLQSISNRLSMSINDASNNLSSTLNTASRSTDSSEFTQSTLDILGDILSSSSSGGGSSSFGRGSSHRSSWGSSSSHRSRSSSSSSSRSSSSRRSGGGGRRGFG